MVPLVDKEHVGAARSNTVRQDSDQGPDILQMARLFALFRFLLPHFLLLGLDILLEKHLVLNDAAPRRVVVRAFVVKENVRDPVNSS